MIEPKDIKGLREETKCPQARLAKAVKMDRSKLSLIERGYVTPSAAELLEIEQALFEEVRQLSTRLAQVLGS